MIDRNVQFPNRYQLQKVAGTDDIYDIIPAPGEISDEGTMINKATLLTDAVAGMFGFGSSAVPNDMFNVLTHAGDLHVWKRTKIISEGIPEVPPSYSLGDAIVGNIELTSINDSNMNVTVSYSSSLTIDNYGNVSLNSPSTQIFNGYAQAPTFIIGSFIQTNWGAFSNKIVFIPTDAQVVREQHPITAHFYSYVDKYQNVYGIPYTPAVPPGTYVDYPVSPNRNAYQEGSDAQPAWYTLGDAIQKVALATGQRANATSIFYADAISVNEDGSIKTDGIVNETAVRPNEAGDVDNYLNGTLQGKFIVIKSRLDNPPSELTQLEVGQVAYIPDDAVFVREIYSSNWIVYASKMQLVTGYPAIPAGTTIEYMGQVGDKARIVMGSYVGTGTYGSSNPSSLQFDSKPRMICFYGWRNGAEYIFGLSVGNQRQCQNPAISLAYVTSSPQKVKTSMPATSDTVSNDLLLYFEDNKLFWYSEVNAAQQGNYAGFEYFYYAVL